MHFPTPKFSFNLTRDYPYPWFPWVAIVGGTVVTVLVSLLSYGTAGYELTPVSSNNPNETEQLKSFLGPKMGKLLGVSQSVCNPAIIPIGTVLYTNNTALAYTLVDSGHVNGTALGSLSYQNSPLENCFIKTITIELQTLDRTALQISRSVIGAQVKAFTTCQTVTTLGTMNVNLTSTYQLAEDGSEQRTFFGVMQNRTTHASLFWAERLVNIHWADLVRRMHEDNKAAENERGTISLHPRDKYPPKNATDVVSLDYFKAWCAFIPKNGTLIGLQMHYCNTSSIPQLMTSDGRGNRPLPAIWKAADNLGKAMTYTVLTDLGQTGPFANPLADPELLSYFTQNVTDTLESPYWNKTKWIHDGTVGARPFATDRSKYHLKVNPSQLLQTYECQIPQRKPIGTLIVAILVTDLVLLQTLWKIFKFIVDEYVLPKDFDMEAQQLHRDQYGPVKAVPSIVRAATKPIERRDSRLQEST